MTQAFMMVIFLLVVIVKKGGNSGHTRHIKSGDGEHRPGGEPRPKSRKPASIDGGLHHGSLKHNSIHRKTKHQEEKNIRRKQ